MGQSRRMSMVEASANTASGFVLSWIAGMIVYPMVGWTVSAAQNTAVVTIFTVISVARSYLWRRAFNWLHSRAHASPSPVGDER